MFVTDSTSGREVESPVQASGDQIYWCAMLWGKTLVHIAQECRRIVSELTSTQRDEICGCLPPLEAWGTAWRPSTLNSVEHVTARIRNGKDILASLAGMPNVAAVHIHGNPQSFVYGLHPDYNVVVAQAFNEMELRPGLTTACVDQLASFLVLQDGFRACDIWENRCLFGRYMTSACC